MSSWTPGTPVLQKPIKTALIQLASGKDKAANLDHAASEVAKAAAGGSKLCVLPECFNSPYGTNYFPEYAEVLVPSDGSKRDAPSYDALSKMAKDNAIFLVGGSIPEYNPATNKYHNTSLIFGPTGDLLATHRKVHLFDIDIPGKITFRESDVLSPGNQVTLVDLEGYGRIAVAICYDVRFPELATVAARAGAFALIYPGAFNLTTGPLHWRLLAQARAVDNQIYVAMCSPARDLGASYHAYGHSLLVDPMAKVVAEAEEAADIVYADIEPAPIDDTRKNIALYNQRRFDVYPDVSKGSVQFHDPTLPQPE
ncbi:omega-amidase [Geosmithia morbida]|uniref:Omega-amidase n=1 Tax=Geosmithia morbida TaxID=1094350 RepID=A0A9P4YVV6_9HYPO|nr:omega-amidase [Geosmithia morbida]KAF4122666.1 omega-amidase [Geosmithia morbida]